MAPNRLLETRPYSTSMVGCNYIVKLHLFSLRHIRIKEKNKGVKGVIQLMQKGEGGMNLNMSVCREYSLETLFGDSSGYARH